MSTSRTREKADGELFKSTGIDDNATSTAVTIDASENVLVGKTSTDLAIAGYRIDPRGFTQNTRSDGSVAYYNRLTSDGEIINFSKDGTTVGSIISDSGSIMLGSGDVGVYFDAASDRILPMNITTGSVRNDAIDIGGNPHRFKDLYLSGGVYLGGTGAANKLDDYEEGTWTPAFGRNGGTQPTVGYSQQAGSYTKVGNMVFLTGDVGVTSISIPQNGTLTITGMPFTKGSTHNPTGSFTSSQFNIYRARGQLVHVDSTKLGFLGQASATGQGSWDWEPVSALDGNESIRFAITYQV